MPINWILGHKSFIAFDRRPSPLVFERIVKSLTMQLQRLEPMTLAQIPLVRPYALPIHPTTNW